MSIAADTIKVIDNTKALDPDFKNHLTLLLNGVETITDALRPSLKAGYTGVFTDLNKIQPVIAALTKLVQDGDRFSSALSTSITKLEASLAELEAPTPTPAPAPATPAPAATQK